MTTIKNNETGEIVDVKLINPATGCDWSGDFIGNVNDGTGKIGELLVCYDEDAEWEGDAETVTWWVDQAEAYQKADDAYHAAVSGSSLSRKKIQDIYNYHVGYVEFNDIPTALNAATEEIESHGNNDTTSVC